MLYADGYQHIRPNLGVVHVRMTLNDALPSYLSSTCMHVTSCTWTHHPGRIGSSWFLCRVRIPFSLASASCAAVQSHLFFGGVGEYESERH